MLQNLSRGFFEDVETKRIRYSKRPLRNETGIIEELLLSVAERGLVQPIVVRPLREEDGFEVVAGNRRLLACKTLGLRKIPCHVIELDDKEAYEMSLVENLQRRTLNPIEEARAFKSYVDEYGYGSETTLARTLGKSPSYVSRRIALLKMSANVQDRLLRGAKVSLTQELFSLNEDDRNALAAFIAENQHLARDDVRLVARLIKKGEGINLARAYLSHYAEEEARRHYLERVVGKFISILEVCEMRLDEVLDNLEKNEWVLREILAQQRMLIHDQIDGLMKLRRRFRHHVPPTEAPSLRRVGPRIRHS
ncbi:MAG: ParB/RepB/Spo0J family partition protein [Nitrososphaerota archaeon]|nr:ParB/RepB/Spo0J family partition protein [Nitrososphaerota archaeon]MDG7026004.1 ParB/RepB/Spo0J family partition protein [Nitrososphaerota archaeon]